MTGAMYAAVAGLKTHMEKLNVIGNNVANANTTGFKAGRMTFMESLYTSVRGGSNGTSTLGGVNPSQIGYGCKVGTIDLDMSTKNYVPTGKPMDVMINGDGFLMVGNKLAAGESIDLDELKLSRVGNLTFDKEGYLTDGQGGIIYGFVTCNGDAAGKPVAGAGLGDVGTSVSTQLVPIRLPMATQKGDAIYPGVTDTTGINDHTFAGDAAAGTLNTNKCITTESVSISETGQITAVNKATGKPVVVGYIALGVVDNPNGVTHLEGPYYKAMDGSGELNVASIGAIVTGNLNNQEDAAGGAGATPVKAILTGSQTKLVPSGLESSGTDIATEFSEMITTQRGYQANTRIITVTDSMLEELVNMKR